LYFQTFQKHTIMKNLTCEHIEAIDEVKTSEEMVCETCAKIGSEWVHLRTCQECGVTLCCDSSEHKHAREHFQLYGHHVIASAEPGEKWLWCYEDERYARYE
jgi:hypothetical protein